MAAPSVAAVDWLRRLEHEVAVNAAVLGEIESGILLLPSGRRRRRLGEWFSGVAEMLPVLDAGRKTARVWVSLLARLRSKGPAVPSEDGLIAASALQRGPAVTTRNTGDFACGGVKLTDPFA